MKNIVILTVAGISAESGLATFRDSQNVDDLHEKAEQGKALSSGYKLLHMHGELKKARCTASEEIFDWRDDMTTQTPCPCCKKAGRLRPHIVWFGEMPLQMELINHMLRQCDLFL